MHKLGVLVAKTQHKAIGDDLLTLREMKLIKRNIKRIKDDISLLENKATNTSANLSFAPKSSGINDKIGGYTARIVDLKTELKALEAKYNSELNHLSIDDDTANCIWLFLHGYSWDRIAKISPTTPEDGYCIQTRVRRYKW